MLLFKRKFRPAILSGEKTRTIRLWRNRHVKPGGVYFAPGIGYLRVSAVDEVTLDDLTEDDARADGFASLAALKAELDRLYADAAHANRRWYRIAFEYVGQSRPA